MNTQGRYDLQAPTAQGDGGQKKCVLVVDDDPMNLKVMKGFLTLDGYDAVVAESGSEALERLTGGDVDLVVLDVRMPEMDGYEVCRRIRAKAAHARMPIIFLTADQADEKRELLGLDAGGDEYLHKPISRRVLNARVRNLLRLADAERERHLLQQIAHSEKLAAIGQVAAGVAHEVNNPLSFMLSNLESLRSYFADLRQVLDAWHESPEAGRALEAKLDVAGILADIAPLLDETAHGGRRVRAIVQELKSFSRQDEAALESVDLADVARSTLLLTEREVTARAQLVRQLEPALVALAPRQKLHQVALNLVVNAIQAVEARPLEPGQRHTITLATRTVGDEVLLEVSDTGCGIPENLRTRIFEPFFTTKPVGIGTGLGLSVCALVAERTGGTIDLRSTVGLGSTFTVRLPQAGAKVETQDP
jgi:two-component system NtrC family sensor kinase